MRSDVTRFVRWLAGACLLGVCACHDAPRKNPFDPELTPQVALQVSLNDTAGTAQLTWTAYEGDMPFAAYWVLRKIQGFEAVETLEVVPDIGLTSYVDSLLIQGSTYVYRVSVVNVRGFETTSSEQVARPLSFPPVEIRRAHFDAPTATASLEWTTYQGPHFQAYELWRDDSVNLSQVADLPDRTTTAFVDSHLVGNTEYTYRIVVRTTRDEKIESRTASGIIHPFVTDWPLEIEGEGTQTEFVRLYAEPDGRISALITGTDRARLLFFDTDGHLLEEQVLLDGPFPLSPRSVATAVDPDGRRFLSLAHSTVGILSFDPDGKPNLQKYEPFDDDFADPLDETERTVLGEIALVSPPNEEGAFKHVTVSSDDQLLLTDNFDGLPEDWFRDTAIDGWEFTGTFANHKGWLRGSAVSRGVARRADPSWRDFRLEANVITSNRTEGEVGIQIGGDLFSRFYLGLNAQQQQVFLEWSFTPSADQEPVSRRFEAPFAVLDRALYRLSLAVVQGQVEVAVHSPVHWSQGGYERSEFVWSSLAFVADQLSLRADDLSYSVDREGRGEVLWSKYEGGVSALSVWDAGGEADSRMGACVPELDQIYAGRMFFDKSDNWSCCFNAFGPRLSPETRNLFYPLSLDGGLDERIYVLDAGNHRIVVLKGVDWASQNSYLTSWGHKGSGPGEFDFGNEEGRIEKGRTLAGSIAVDDRGYIYVADVGNRRIQKFAP